MLKEMLEDFVKRGGLVFTHTGRYTNSNNKCFIFDERRVRSGMKVDLYSNGSGALQDDNKETLYNYLNRDDTFYKVYTGQLGGELQNLLHQLCQNKECLNKVHQVYFKVEDGYELMVPLTDSSNLKNLSDFTKENKYYKTFNHQLGGKNSQNISHSAVKVKGCFKTFDTTPMTLEVNNA